MLTYLCSRPTGKWTNTQPVVTQIAHGLYILYQVAGLIPAGVSGFFIDIKSFQSRYGPGVNSASKIYEYQEYFLGVKAGGA